MGHCDLKVGREDTLEHCCPAVLRNFINVLDSGMSMLIKYPIDSKLDVLANALETGLKLKMTFVIGRIEKIGKG